MDFQFVLFLLSLLAIAAVVFGILFLIDWPRERK